MKVLITLFLALLSPEVDNSIYSATGRVYAFKDTALQNIKVKAAKSGEIVRTNEYGEFKIKIKKKDRLIFTGGGFNKFVKAVKSGDKLVVKMVFLTGSKNEEIAVGQGHMSKEDLTYSISNFLDYNNDYHTYPDIFSLLAGKFPGVKVVPMEMGEKRVVIRGIQYLSEKDNSALYIVDGQIWQDISVLQPQNIKSIRVLKDGSSLGFRAVNGAVVITTIDEYGMSKTRK